MVHNTSAGHHKGLFDIPNAGVGVRRCVYNHCFVSLEAENKTKYMKCTRKATQLDTLKVGNMQIDQVRLFSYLGSIVIENNTLEEESRERIAKEIKHSTRTKLFLQANWCLENPN
jgi:hypothetical protein